MLPVRQQKVAKLSEWNAQGQLGLVDICKVCREGKVSRLRAVQRRGSKAAEKSQFRCCYTKVRAGRAVNR